MFHPPAPSPTPESQLTKAELLSIFFYTVLFFIYAGGSDLPVLAVKLRNRNLPFYSITLSSDRQSLFWSEISYNKPPPRLPGLAY